MNGPKRAAELPGDLTAGWATGKHGVYMLYLHTLEDPLLICSLQLLCLSGS